MKLRNILFAAASALVLFSPSHLRAQAQSRPQQVVVYVTIPEMMFLEAAQGEVRFPQVHASDLRDGYVTSMAPTVLDASSNVLHLLAVRSEASHFLNVEGEVTEKPIEDLEWSIDNGSSWVPMATQFRSPPSFSAHQASSKYTVRYRLKVRPGQDRPGQYVVPLSFVLLHP